MRVRMIALALLVPLLGGCRSEPAEVLCGELLADAGCEAGQYCACDAYFTSVDARDFPGCRAASDAGDPQVALSAAGAPGICRACSWTSHCPAGRWDSTACGCVAR